MPVNFQRHWLPAVGRKVRWTYNLYRFEAWLPYPSMLSIIVSSESWSRICWTILIWHRHLFEYIYFPIWTNCTALHGYALSQSSWLSFTNCPRPVCGAFKGYIIDLMNGVLSTKERKCPPERGFLSSSLMSRWWINATPEIARAWFGPGCDSSLFTVSERVCSWNTRNEYQK